jgi:hypothetical protein
MALNSVFSFIKMPDRELKFVYLFWVLTVAVLMIGQLKNKEPIELGDQ